MDAYAQSNTDRLNNIEENTSAIQVVVDAINAIVTSISNTLNEISANIMEIGTVLTSVNASVNKVESEVATISMNVSEIKLIIPTVNSMNETISNIDGKMNSFETTDNSLVIQTVAEKLNNLDQEMLVLSDQMDIIDRKLDHLLRNNTTLSE